MEMMQPQDYVPHMDDSSKQAKIGKITEAYHTELAETKKTLKIVKEINVELRELTEKYRKEVLERTDRLAQLGQFAASKDFSKMVLALNKMVPHMELEASMKNLEIEINQKLAEMG